MKVLLDEDLPHKLRLALIGHEASTAWYMNWSGLKNGALLKAAEDAGFEVFMTADKNLSYQQNLRDRQIAVVVLSSQDWGVLRMHLRQIEDVLNGALPGSFQFLNCIEGGR